MYAIVMRRSLQSEFEVSTLFLSHCVASTSTSGVGVVS